DKHPTTATHRYIADLALETLNSEPQKSVPEPASVVGLFAIGVFGAGSMLKRKVKKVSLVKVKVDALR
ncbi:MAG TPA: PEP-CTERM sorting domain-containing protein, partial [Cyanophyceae cyanobacterium]